MSTNNLKSNHYTYKISFQSGHFYFGVRSCKCLPEDDYKYLGTPLTHKKYWEENICCKTILRKFESREEAQRHESILIHWGWSIRKELSLNASDMGTKFHTVGMKRSPENLAKIAKPFKIYHKNLGFIEDVNLWQYASSRGLKPKQMHKVIKGVNLSYLGTYFKDEDSYKKWQFLDSRKVSKFRGTTKSGNSWVANVYIFQKSYYIGAVKAGEEAAAQVSLTFILGCLFLWLLVINHCRFEPFNISAFLKTIY